MFCGTGIRTSTKSHKTRREILASSVMGLFFYANFEPNHDMGCVDG